MIGNCAGRFPRGKRQRAEKGGKGQMETRKERGERLAKDLVAKTRAQRHTGHDVLPITTVTRIVRRRDGTIAHAEQTAPKITLEEARARTRALRLMQ